MIDKTYIPVKYSTTDKKGYYAEFYANGQLKHFSFYENGNCDNSWALYLEKGNDEGKIRLENGYGGTADFELYGDGSYERFDAWSDSSPSREMPYEDWVNKWIKTIAQYESKYKLSDTTPKGSKDTQETQDDNVIKIDSKIDSNGNLNNSSNHVESGVELEKMKKEVSRIGSLISAVGRLSITASVVIYILSLVDKNFTNNGLPSIDLFDVIITIFGASILITQGQRIKKLVDVNIQRYLHIVLCLAFLFLFGSVVAGGRVGIIALLLLWYIIYGLMLVRKLIKIPEFSSTLSKPKYMLNKKGWLIYSIGTFILLVVIASFMTIGTESVTN